MKKNDFFIAPRGTKQTFTCEQAPDGTLCLLGDKQFIKNGIAIIAFPVEKRRTYSTDSEDIILYEVFSIAIQMKIFAPIILPKDNAP